MIPAYIETIDKDLLGDRIDKARGMLKSCTLCPRKCGVDRLAGETGICHTAAKARVSSFNPHFGEEAPLVGTRGSGTIFFTHCNLMCVFCQNYDISHLGYGQQAEPDQLAAVMLELQRSGCHNINFVTPSHVVPQILESLRLAVEAGLRIPLVYNSGGYDRVSTLRLLDGIVDIYMPDFKFWDAKVAADACDAPDYPAVARRALVEMHRQVGDLVIDESGVATRGVLIRHLVLPGNMAGTREVMRFIAGDVSPNSYVNIMAQYRPCGRADEVEGLEDFPTTTDYTEAVRAAKEEGIRRLDRPRRTFMLW
jgi:putative pyruvate formate lyase activating enzyme